MQLLINRYTFTYKQLQFAECVLIIVKLYLNSSIDKHPEKKMSLGAFK